jgi:hypothetical protein
LLAKDDDGVCCVCLRDEAFGTILICDACDNEYHLNCLNPPITTIPEGDWFCPKCDHSPKKRPASKASDKGPRPKKASRPRPAPVDVSEDRCGLCGCEGELLVCDFPGCSKVYHYGCIWPLSKTSDVDSQWLCPRHTCSVCGVMESSDHKVAKCTRCILSVCEKHVEYLGTASTDGCELCGNASPQVQLAHLLHDAWAKMSTHYLSLPFMRPFLSIQTNDDSPHDLLAVAEKIRKLEYTKVSEFSADVEKLREKCVALAPEYPMIHQSFDTLMLNVRYFINNNLAKFQHAEDMLKAQQSNTNHLIKVDDLIIGLQGQACEMLPSMTPDKTLDQWREFVLNPPILVRVFAFF